jgi:hypothetical protein
MIQKLKEWGAWILTPLFVLIGAIYLLTEKNRALKDELAREKADRELGQTLQKLDNQKERADDAEAKFDRSLADLKRALADDEQS